MKNGIIILFLLHLTICSFSQNSLTVNELSYEVKGIYPPLSITKEKLNDAHTLMHINRYYQSSWVREFISVEILASYKGKIRRAVSNNDILTQEQKDIMDKVDVGTEIEVNVRYIPENTLTHNDVKVFDFNFMVHPENEAKYIGGQQELKQYLKENAIDKIPDGIFEGYDLAVVKFTISEIGEITDVNVFETSKDEKTDQLLLETICNMPNWKPAEYANGTKAKQEFALMVGNMENCVVYTLNTLRD
ncbi:MAG: hypothetical protein AB8B69_03275 [Chitinophagales bacterium]